MGKLLLSSIAFVTLTVFAQASVDNESNVISTLSNTNHTSTPKSAKGSKTNKSVKVEKFIKSEKVGKAAKSEIVAKADENKKYPKCPWWIPKCEPRDYYS